MMPVRLFVFFISLSFGCVLHNITLSAGLNSIPLNLKVTEKIQIFHEDYTTSYLQVFIAQQEVVVESTRSLDISYCVIDNNENYKCPECPYDCSLEYGECTKLTPKGVGTFTFDTFLDLLMPTKSVVIFCVFGAIVVVSICMICTMTCRFVDCFTDIMCNKAKQEKKKFEKQMLENMKEKDKHRTIELTLN
ncbi:hypothetical protein EIN_026260 [Entamoeba invadens IP1]|uniref:hypothetical protein n=1 Tax=Entamoeba invadens IP1 TaxID=370355 RepID=UPI0002C3FBF4|nr:hypothetical protein EIN_026260 [Entamoeba invadens IP1]ELP90777.1 hypothetical protein EIN_026260 [Entamoeba invadens IP1]|eukprot:XP_004257548.1 hypothetical protein EIN_026260 [Entamoeba invadens IP1]